MHNDNVLLFQFLPASQDDIHNLAQIFQQGFQTLGEQIVGALSNLNIHPNRDTTMEDEQADFDADDESEESKNCRFGRSQAKRSKSPWQHLPDRVALAVRICLSLPHMGFISSNTVQGTCAKTHGSSCWQGKHPYRHR